MSRSWSVPRAPGAFSLEFRQTPRIQPLFWGCLQSLVCRPLGRHRTGPSSPPAEGHLELHVNGTSCAPDRRLRSASADGASPLRDPNTVHQPGAPISTSASPITHHGRAIPALSFVHDLLFVLLFVLWLRGHYLVLLFLYPTSEQLPQTADVTSSEESSSSQEVAGFFFVKATSGSLSSSELSSAAHPRGSNKGDTTESGL